MFETHIKGAISWLQSCIDNNKHKEQHTKFTEFNAQITEMDK